MSLNDDLETAIYEDDRVAIKKLLRQDVSFVGALYNAVTYNNTYAVKLILKYKDVKYLDVDNIFLSAIRRGNIDITKLLIPLNTRANNLDKGLCHSAIEGNIALAKLLIASGANVNYNDGEPLYGACNSNKMRMVKFLLANGADPVLGNDRCLAAAYYANYKDIAKLLIENGAGEVKKDIALKLVGVNGIIKLKRKVIRKKFRNIDISPRDVGHKTNTDLELLLKLKGYLVNA